MFTMVHKVPVPLFALVILHVLGGTRGYNLTIHPPHARISEDPNTLSVTCVASVVLTGCQFIWRDEKHSGPIMDLGQGQQSRANPSQLDNFITNYSYNGRGLVAGDCGITMHLNGVKVWMIGCRVHAALGGWKYAWTDLFAHSAGLLPNTVTPREAVVFPGTEAKLILKAMVPLDLCHFYVPGVTGQINLDKGPHSTQSVGRQRYHGAGVQIGECGLALYNITEANNGPARCYIRNTRTTTDDYKYIPLIVARAPTPPIMHGYYEGVSIKATCTVSSSRPPPNMTWLLGDDVVRQDASDDSPAEPQDEWRWPWMKTSTIQKLTHKLRSEDDGKVLRCVVTHVALSQPMEAVKRITFIQSTSGGEGNDSPTASRMKTGGDQYPDRDEEDREEKETPTTAAPPAPSTVAAVAPTVPAVAHNKLVHAEGRPPKDDTREYRIREARAAAAAAEHGLEAARFRARAEDSRARAEETRATEARLLVEAAQSRARAEEARARVEEALATAAEVMVKAAQARARAEDARALRAEDERDVAAPAQDEGAEESRYEAMMRSPLRLRDYEREPDDRYRNPPTQGESAYGYEYNPPDRAYIRGA